MNPGRPHRLSAAAATATTVALVALGALAGCVEETSMPAPGSVPRPPIVVQAKTLPGPPPAEWTYWDPVEPALRVDVPRVPSLPLVAPQVTHALGAQARWAALPESARIAFHKNGFVAVEPPALLDDTGDGPTLADLYASLERDKVPALLTADALLFLAQAAIDRAVADLEATVLGPALVRVLASLTAALAVEDRAVRRDAVEGVHLARGFVAVASALAAGTPPPADAAPLVEAELRLIEASAGRSQSPMFGVELDYASFAPSHALRPSPEGDARARLRFAQAATWLARAPFLLSSRGETEGSRINVQTARVHTRAALLLGGLLARESSRERSDDYAKLQRVLSFLLGPADDPSPVALLDVAKAAGEPMDRTASLADVARVDRVRRAALTRFEPGVYDGVAAVRVPETAQGPTSAGVGRAALGVRFLGASGPVDSQALQGLVFPFVGHALREAGSTSLSGHRAFATATDVVAWLGSAEARRVRRESGDDAFEGWDTARERTERLRPAPLAPARHATLHMSLLDVLSTYLEPSRGELSLPASFTSAYGRRKVEVAVCAWAHERHDARPFARAPAAAAAAPRARPKLEVRDAPVYVEPHPEALGHLLALLRQAARGLAAHGLPKGSRGELALTELEDLVDAAYQTATRATNEQPPTVELAARLAGVAGRLAWLEEAVGLRTGGVLAVHVHADPVSGRASVAGIGGLTEIHVALRDPRTGGLVHVIGPRLSAVDVVWPRSKALHDAALKADLGKSPLAPPPFVSAYYTR
ncbi:MAG TPA: DUF3160 domain-containing protein [Polyangiaceae bacterium]|nr:DUF3160 domain-containing protein [Polyangiaceae bacterium]